MKRPGLQLVLLVTVLVFAAGQACRESGGKSSRCYLDLKRESPGRLVLEEPVACSRAAAHYRLEESPGGRARPERIDYLDPSGSVRLSYRVRYDDRGHPRSEERLYRFEPTAYKLYGGRSLLEFSGPAKGEWEMVRILTDLDPRGRPIRVRKFAGAALQYKVVLEYQEGRLQSRTTYGKNQELTHRTVYFSREGRRMERMLGPDGKVLLEREVEKKNPVLEQDLDTSGRGPVHSPMPGN